MQLTTVVGSLLALNHPIVPDHAGYSESILLEKVRPPPRLRRSMSIERFPSFDRLLITPNSILFLHEQISRVLFLR